MTTQHSTAASGDPARASGAESVTVTDNRTGSSYEMAITDGTVRATELRQIKVDDDDFGLMTYDPGFMNTASCRSSITFLDGERGILRYRGYPIEQLAAGSTFVEVAYLLLEGGLPDDAALARWTDEVGSQMPADDAFGQLIGALPRDAHPMGVLQSAIAALGTLHPESKDVSDPQVRREQIIRLIGATPTLGAWAYRHGVGRSFVQPRADRDYPTNFLAMMFGDEDGSYSADPRIVRALDILLILHADHEQNCSTSTVRAVGSGQADPYASVSAGIGALYGPLHGGANEAVLQMLSRIGSTADVSAFIEGVKGGKERLMGFGHRVYKNYDPRAAIIKKACDDVFEVTGVNPKLEIAIELERIALEDEYFVSRRLYPNVDFYSGLIYEALGIPVEMFTVMFAIGRMPGWVAQWNELCEDKEQKIARPRQVYTGADARDYVPVAQR